MKLSVCIITKNEKENLIKCVKTLLMYPFEVVVVDTGSTDGTVEELRQLEEMLKQEGKCGFCEQTILLTDFFEWCDDFSAARNYAISKARHEFVLIIDSDEFLQPFDVEKLEKIVMQYPDKVGRIKICNSMDKKSRENVEWVSRLFSRKKFHYTGRIHEQVEAFDKTAYETYCLPISVEHVGYDLSQEEKRKKAIRNEKLLLVELREASYDIELEPEKAVANMKEKEIPYLLYQLGKSYYMEGNYIDACDFFARGLFFDLDPRLEYVVDMVESYGYALINTGRANEAIFIETLKKEFGNEADFWIMLGHVYMNNERFEEAIDAFLHATHFRRHRMVGANSFLAYYNAGVVLECMGKRKQAEEYYEKCGNYKPAKERLKMKRRDVEDKGCI